VPHGHDSRLEIRSKGNQHVEFFSHLCFLDLDFSDPFQNAQWPLQVWDPYSVLAPTCHNGMRRLHKEGSLEGDKFATTNTPFLAHIREKYDLDTV